MAKKRTRTVSQPRNKRKSVAVVRVARARSLRASKGWETRRENERSNAAKKGWETRRSRKAFKSAFAGYEKPKPRLAEYAVSADYKARKRGSSVTIQISAIGPANATKQDVQDATAEKINTGQSPRGWQIKIVDWRGKRENQSTSGAWKAFSAPLALARLSVHKVGKT